ncbi:MAG: hypothetical protein Q4B99_04215 [Clostridia bacterium]|nr:hypothetical protein [Clostridia bacterium]
MTNVLGLPLEEALKLLRDEGVAAVCAETSARGRIDDGEARVVRAVERGGVLELTYALFRTNIGQSE